MLSRQFERVPNGECSSNRVVLGVLSYLSSHWLLLFFRILRKLLFIYRFVRHYVSSSISLTLHFIKQCDLLLIPIWPSPNIRPIIATSRSERETARAERKDRIWDYISQRSSYCPCLLSLVAFNIEMFLWHGRLAHKLQVPRFETMIQLAQMDPRSVERAFGSRYKTETILFCWYMFSSSFPSDYLETEEGIYLSLSRISKPKRRRRMAQTT